MLGEDSNMEEPAQKEADINEDDHTLPQHALWVEKYSPRHFTELLSDDVSRNVLFVFGWLVIVYMYMIVCWSLCIILVDNNDNRDNDQALQGNVLILT